MTKCFIFPGQGSQSVGMGEALAEAFPAAREVFEEVDDALGRRLSSVMFEGPSDELSLTTNTQPALMAHSIAMLRVLESEVGADIADSMFVAGHSLGEYSGLCAARSLTLSQTAKLLAVRGEAMQEAVPLGEGAMAALIGVDLEGAQAAIDASPVDGVCEIANDNAPGQIVISGAKARVEDVASNAKAHGAKLAKLLQVSAPFHCSLMEPAAKKMQAALDGITLKAPVTPLVANVTASENVDPEKAKTLLVEQVTGRVRWTESVEYMVAKGVDTFIEVGSGKVLSGLIKRITKEARFANIGEPGDIESFLKL